MSALTAELAAIDDEREAVFVALREANAAGLTGDAVDAVLDRMHAVDERVAVVKAEHFGAARYRKHRLIVALGAAYLVSPTGRSSRLLWRRAS